MAVPGTRCPRVASQYDVRDTPAASAAARIDRPRSSSTSLTRSASGHGSKAPLKFRSSWFAVGADPPAVVIAPAESRQPFKGSLRSVGDRGSAASRARQGERNLFGLAGRRRGRKNRRHVGDIRNVTRQLRKWHPRISHATASSSSSGSSRTSSTSGSGSTGSGSTGSGSGTGSGRADHSPLRRVGTPSWSANTSGSGGSAPG